MVVVIVTPQLEKEIYKLFKGDSVKIFKLMKSLEENPKKGKFVGLIGNTVIKELKYKTFRFYFITDYRQLKFLDLEELQDLIIKFMQLFDKKNQQIVIDELKSSLISIEHIVSEQK